MMLQELCGKPERLQSRSVERAGSRLRSFPSVYSFQLSSLAVSTGFVLHHVNCVAVASRCGRGPVLSSVAAIVARWHVRCACSHACRRFDPPALCRPPGIVSSSCAINVQASSSRNHRAFFAALAVRRGRRIPVRNRARRACASLREQG